MLRDPSTPELQEARERVLAASKSTGPLFLDTMNPDNAKSKIDEGVRVGEMYDKRAARIAHEYAKRTMPV